MSKFRYIAVFLFFAIVFSVLVFASGKILDPDIFYHARHAALYREHGIFFGQFPWVTASVISNVQTDLWYGYHLLLAPLTFFNPLTATRIVGIILSALFLTLFYCFLRRRAVPQPFLWTALLFVAMPDFLLHVTLARPQTVSLIVLLGLIIAHFEKLQLKKQFLVFAILGFISAFVHTTFFPILLGVALVLTVTQSIAKKQWYWGGWIFLAAGFVGLVARPHPLGIFTLLKVQLINLFLYHETIPLLSGIELHKLTANDALRFLWPIGLAAVIVFLFARGYANIQESRREKFLRWALCAMGVLFVALAFFSARRALDIALPVLVAALALRAKGFTETQKTKFVRGIFAGLWVIVLFAGLENVQALNAHTKSVVAFAPERSKAIGEWMQKNAPPNAIVFNSAWDTFGPLFYWNTNARYINGMDPIFEYSFSRNLYFKHYFITTSGKTYTCGVPECTESNGEDIYTVLTRDFHANYIALDSRNKGLAKNLDEDRRFRKVVETGDEKLYEIR